MIWILVAVCISCCFSLPPCFPVFLSLMISSVDVGWVLITCRLNSMAEGRGGGSFSYYRSCILYFLPGFLSSDESNEDALVFQAVPCLYSRWQHCPIQGYTVLNWATTVMALLFLLQLCNSRNGWPCGFPSRGWIYRLWLFLGRCVPNHIHDAGRLRLFWI